MSCRSVQVLIASRQRGAQGTRQRLLILSHAQRVDQRLSGRRCDRLVTGEAVERCQRRTEVRCIRQDGCVALYRLRGLSEAVLAQLAQREEKRRCRLGVVSPRCQLEPSLDESGLVRPSVRLLVDPVERVQRDLVERIELADTLVDLGAALGAAELRLRDLGGAVQLLRGGRGVGVAASRLDQQCDEILEPASLCEQQLQLLHGSVAELQQIAPSSRPRLAQNELEHIDGVVATTEQMELMGLLPEQLDAATGVVLERCLETEDLHAVSRSRRGRVERVERGQRFTAQATAARAALAEETLPGGDGAICVVEVIGGGECCPAQ